MQYLSIYENEWEAKDFLFQNGFITEEDRDSEDCDLLSWFEGDPSFIDIKQGDGDYFRVYFITFNPCWKYEGEQVCLHTGDSAIDAEPIRQYLENSQTFTGYEPNSWEEMEEDKQHDLKIAFRDMGYIYTLAFA